MSRGRVEFGPPSVEKALGALPVVAAFARRLDVAGIVDRAVPVRDIAYATHGEVIEALVANRLTSPTPLVHVEDWARDWAVEEIFGISPEVLNDDRIGRALDAVAPHLEGIVGSVGARAIASFGVDVGRIHWDMTSISLYAFPASERGRTLASCVQQQSLPALFPPPPGRACRAWCHRGRTHRPRRRR